MFFQKQGPVWDTLRDLAGKLESVGIDYAVIGGMALSAHRYERTTTNVDIVVSPAGFDRFDDELAHGRYLRSPSRRRRFQDTQTDVNVDFRVAGELAGHPRKNKSVVFPDPSAGEVHDNVRTVSLQQLIELKLVTWRFKDWGDVVELIRVNELGEDFAEKIDPVVRSAYLQCYDQMVDEDTYSKEK